MTLTDLWIAALREAYLLARSSHVARLEGRYVPERDDRGLRPYDVAWGRIWAYQELEPGLTGAGADPVLMRSEARKDALQMVYTRLKKGEL